MNAMLDARMVAARIQCLAFAQESIKEAVGRIRFSSQGVRIDAMDAILRGLGSEIATGTLSRIPTG
jgi:hypothetical protein